MVHAVESSPLAGTWRQAPVGVLSLRAAAIVWVAALLCAFSPATSSPTPAPVAARADFVRGAYGKDGSGPGFGVMAATGFNSVMTGPYRELIDPLEAHGLKGVVWLGNWVNAPTCAFERTDAAITTLVTAIRGEAGVLAYYLGDEPHATECPNAPAMFKKRSDLVHALDPGSKTFTVIQAYENGTAHDYARWAGTVDVIGFDVYPCKKGSATCDFGAIDAAIGAIEAAHIPSYWAILQDFQDCYYRLPTPQELKAEFDHWARSRMSGYFIFSWNYQPADPNCVGATLSSHPDHIAALKTENARLFSPQPPRLGPSSSGSGGVSIAVIAVVVLVFVGLGVLAFPRRPWMRS